IRQPLIHKLRVGLIVFISRIVKNSFCSALALSPSRVFLKKFLDNKLKGFLIGDINIDDSDDIDASHAIDDSETIDRDLDTELELLTMMNALNMDMLSKI
ncbi:hypothetical protein Godav_011265, partial [Gossypium davidsonii]|nr:hypothetical protein [Gossypium davidsonii]